MESNLQNNRINSLYDSISQDLSIAKFKVESDNDYHNRLIYSAIARWLLTTFSDRDFEEYEYDDEINRVSKKHCTLICLNILESFKELDINLSEYFKDKDFSLQFINYIEEMYAVLGYINNGTYFFNNQKYISKINFGSRDLVIDCKTNLKRTRGIGVWRKNKEDFIQVEDYLICKLSAYNYALKMINLLNFNEYFQKDGHIEFYDFRKNKWVLYESKLIDDYDYGILKIDNGLEYKIIKKNNDKIYAGSLPRIYSINNQVLVFKHEIWRIILGLCSINKTPAKCEILINQNDSIIISFGGYILPEQEEALLKCMVWPVNNCNNISEFITDFNMLDSVKKIISRLSIEIKEETLNE